MESNSKLPCRLCYYDTSDTVDIFGEDGVGKDYVGKIRKYLYLLVDKGDEGRQSICWMCTQQLEAFHQFFAKINQIQKSVHKDQYHLMIVPDPEPGMIGQSLETEQPLNSDQQSNGSNIPEENAEEIQRENRKRRARSPVSPIDSRDLVGPEATQTLKIEPVDDHVQIMADSIKREQCEENAVHSTNPELSTPKRGRGRPRKTPDTTPKNKVTQSLQIVRVADEESVPKPGKLVQSDENETEKRPTPKRGPGRPKRQIDPNAPEQQQRPSSLKKPRHPDAEEWTPDMDNFPSKIMLPNGRFLYKGRQLLAMVCKFYTLECDICKDSIEYKDLESLYTHFSMAHDSKGYVTCCAAQFTNYPAMTTHMAKHIQPSLFKCEICDYSCSRPAFLSIHRKTHLPDDEKPFQCYICKRSFCWKAALFNHMITHQPPEERKKHMCHVCGKTYDNIGSLSTHKKLQHTNREREHIVCDVCAKQFATRAGLNEHKATIHQPREANLVQCPKCAKWCMNQRCLKSHMLLHTGALLECTLCEYTTKKKSLLKRHHDTKHSSIRPFVCLVCNNTFKTKSALAGHMRQSHDPNAVQYSCNFCDRKFNSSTNFYTHRKLQHPIELEQMRRREDERKRLARIRAGIEDGNGVEEGELSAKSDDEYGDDIEIEIIQVNEDDEENDHEEQRQINKREPDEEEEEEEMSVLIDIIDEEEDEIIG